MTIVKIEIMDEVKLKFPFIKFISHMVSLIPFNDIIGLNKIIIQNDFQIKSFKDNNLLQAYYFRKNNVNKGYIKIALNNIINHSIPNYAFELYSEIGGLLLSEIVFHEIGHHVHFNKRHGFTKDRYEIFANKYAKTGFLAYLHSRSSKILSSYKLAAQNVFYFKNTERLLLLNARQELVEYLSNNEPPAFP